ncbi:MAG: 4-alpha-glucanotransferase [Candidatus Omnitrophota bacterium]
MPELNLNGSLLNTPSRDKWERAGTFKRAGVLAPLFSVYSKKSIGIGDLADLKLLIDWAAVTGNSIIQLLPLNETGSLFCPYDSISSFALEPAYISFEDIPAAVSDRTIQVKIKDLKRHFPAGKGHLDYAIKKEKIQLLRETYSYRGHGGSWEFKEFREQNAYWLKDFALYRALKEYHKGNAWYDWETKFKVRDQAALEVFYTENEAEVLFQMWVQWQLYLQFKSAREYALAKKILLKGDLPIFVSRDSVDVWAHPEFFKLDYASGAPPDMYCAKGQRWGMPTYDWGRIEAEDFRYLKEKLKYAQNFYDILRIDHVVGLFRIWSIPYSEPLENKGLNGSFDPGDEREWAGHGRKLLNVILNNTNMLLCAEDLGVIPKACPDTLKELGILGNDVQRWVKDWRSEHDFLGPEKYRAFSVAMLSTHDTTNWPAWWENEAGTVDEDLFIRKCGDNRQINFDHIKDKLFDLGHSKHGRLRWLNSVNSIDKLVAILSQGLSPQACLPAGRGPVPKEHLLDFIDLYENTFQEKERLWKHMKLSGPMREKCDPKITRRALEIVLNSSALFCVNTIIDWLYMANIFKGDPYQYRINTPGTISDKNWSLAIPLSLEDLLKHKVNKEIRNMIIFSGRI